MSEAPVYDLSFVAFHRRAEILRRIEVINDHLADPKRHTAKMAAAELGIGRIQFWTLVKAWKGSRTVEAVAGARSKPKPRMQLTLEQRTVIALAAAEKPDGPLERAIDHAFALARSRGVDMPARVTVTKHLRIARAGRMPIGTWADGAAVVVEHCVVDLPVGGSSGKPLMPLATLVLHTRTATVLGLALTDGAPSAHTTARAIADAMASSPGAFHSKAPNGLIIAIDRFDCDDGEARRWDEILRIVAEMGLTRIGQELEEPRDAVIVWALIGALHAGVHLRPRITRRPMIARIARLWKDGAPVTLEVAEATLRGRWKSAAAAADPPAQSIQDQFDRSLADMRAVDAIS